jgi:hypothetical protein
LINSYSTSVELIKHRRAQLEAEAARHHQIQRAREARAQRRAEAHGARHPFLHRVVARALGVGRASRGDVDRVEQAIHVGRELRAE